MDQILKKKYKLEIEKHDGETVIFEYEQATIKELLEMQEEIADQNNIKPWLMNFLMKKTKIHGTIKEEDFNFILPKRVLEVTRFIMRTYGKGFFTEKKPVENKEKSPEAPISSMFAFTMAYSNETLESILNMTWEQLQFINEGIIWNENEKTKEGRNRNKRNLAMKQYKEELDDSAALQAVREMEEKLKNNQIKFQKHE